MPGVGKTHLAVALGIKAVEQGYKIQFPSTQALIHPTWDRPLEAGGNSLLDDDYGTVPTHSNGMSEADPRTFDLSRSGMFPELICNLADHRDS